MRILFHLLSWNAHLYLLALYNAKRLFGCIGKGNSPFTAETASQIRKIALYVLVFAVFSAFSVKNKGDTKQNEGKQTTHEEL